MNDNINPDELSRLADEAVALEREILAVIMPTLRGKDMRTGMAAILGISAAIANAAKFPPELYREAVLSMADAVESCAQELPDDAA